MADTLSRAYLKNKTTRKHEVQDVININRSRAEQEATYLYEILQSKRSRRILRQIQICKPWQQFSSMAGRRAKTR